MGMNSSSSDDDRLQIGAATYGDLELYHDGTNSYIDGTTNDLYIRTTGSGAEETATRRADDSTQRGMVRTATRIASPGIHIHGRQLCADSS